MKFIDERIEIYSLEGSNESSKECLELEAYTRKVEPMAQMLIGKLEASLLGTLIRCKGAKRILEIGTFTGYSALAMAEQLPQEGVVETIDIQQKNYTEKYWSTSPHGHKIKMHLGPALEVIPQLKGNFDLVFIDADKENYVNYFNLIESRLNPHGLIVVDNVLWSGKVLQTDNELLNDKVTLAIKNFNLMIKARNDLHKTLLPIRDGVYLISKKS